MKRILIAVPEGYNYVELEVPDGVQNFIKPRAIKQIPNGREITMMFIDELTPTTEELLELEKGV